MSYHLEEFVKFLGNPLDGTMRNNVLYFEFGKTRSRRIAVPGDLPAAEEFVKRNDGKHQLYINVNPYKAHATGKGKDLDVKDIKTLYIDADRIKTPESKNNPATQDELDAIPIDAITEAIATKYTPYYSDFTGNGYRFLVPVENGTPDDEGKIVDFMYGLFPEYIDRNVRDPSRITGIPGTMNVKTEDVGRPNRQRQPFGTDTVRVEQPVATFTEGQIKTFDPKPSENSTVKRDYKPVEPDADIQKGINKYILGLSKTAPYALDLLQSEAPEGTGFQVDGFFAAEILNKVGDHPRLYATIMRAFWGGNYDARATERVWNNAKSEGVGVWTKQTFTRIFGTKFNEVK